MSDFLQSLIDKAKGFDWGSTPVENAPTEEHAVRRDTYDKLAWPMITDQVPVLAEQVTALAEDFPTSPPAYEDLFNLLIQGAPRFHAEEQVKPDYRPQRQMLEQMHGSDEFAVVRRVTQYEEYATAFALVAMEDQVRQAFEDMQDAMAANQEAAQELQGATEDAEQAQATGEGEDEAGEALQAALEQAEAAQEQTDQATEQASRGLVKAATMASDDIEAERALMASYGVGDGELKRMSFEERRALAEQLSQGKMRRLAKMLGAFRRAGNAERRRKVVHAPGERFDVETGNDLTRLIPSEINNLAVPELDDLFWVRWAQHGLLQYVTRGTENLNRGPVIIVCDESMSMDQPVDAEGNTREMWSKAVALMLCDQAQRGKRDLTYIGFASARQQWETTFLGGVTPIAQVIEFVEHFFDGGTSYEEPLTRAMELVAEAHQAGKPKPDIVFITDDDCKVSEQFIELWRQMRNETDVRCYGIQIGGSPYANQMKDLVDHAMSLDDLTSDAVITELSRTL